MFSSGSHVLYLSEEKDGVYMAQFLTTAIIKSKFSVHCTPPVNEICNRCQLVNWVDCQASKR